MTLLHTGARRFVPLLTIVLACAFFTLPVATQAARGGRRHVWINGREAAAGEVLVKYKDQRARVRQMDLESRADIDESFLVCPVCTTRLRQACTNCKAPLEPLWQVCPFCETPIESPTPIHFPPLEAPRSETGSE